MRKNIYWLALIMISWLSLLDARVRPNGSRLWDFAKETIEQEADYIITQANIPLTITLPGVYRLAESINAVDTTLITISSDNVVLDLNGKVISGNSVNGLAIGIAITANRNNIIIQNGFIIGEPLLDLAILADFNCEGIYLKNLICRNFTFFQTGIRIGPAKNVVIDSCTVADSTADLAQFGGIEELLISNCLFTNAGLSNCVNIVQSSGVHVKNCIFKQGGPGIHIASCRDSMMENCQAIDCAFMGFSIDMSNDIVVKNCVASNIRSTLSPSAIGFSITTGSGYEFIDCVAQDIVVTVTDETSFAAGFLLSSQQCAKLLNCEAYDISNANNDQPSLANSYGIYLQPVLNQLVTDASFTPTYSSSFERIAWAPDALFFVSSLSATTQSLQLFEYNRQTNTITLDDFLILANPFAVAWHPSGKFIAASDGLNLLIIPFDRINKKFGTPLVTTTAVDILSLDFSADGRFLAVGGVGGPNLLVYSFDQVTGAISLVSSFAQGSSPHAVSWHPSGNFLAVGDFVGNVVIYAFDKNAGSWALTVVAGGVAGGHADDVNWSFDGLYLLATSSDNLTVTVFIFDSIGLTLTQVAQASVGSTSSGYVSAHWSADGKYIAVANGFDTAAIYSFSRQNNILAIQTVLNETGFQWIRWAPDGAIIAVASFDQFLSVVSGLTFPAKNILKNNITYCITGQQGAYGIGIVGSSIENVITGNESYNNNFAYQFVTNVYNNGLDGAPTLLENIAIPPA